MIESLRIENLALIQRTQVELSPALNVITGETGAGKTMLLTSLQLLSGAKADPAVVRTGAEKAFVEATAVIGPQVSEMVKQVDGYVEDGAVEMGRTVSSKSRSKAQLGGRTVPAGILAEVSEHLLSIHGQASQWRLKERGAQRQALDSFADKPHQKALRQYQQDWQQWQKKRQEWQEFQDTASQRQAERQQWENHWAALEELAPNEGEYAQLGQTIGRLSNVEQLRSGLEAAVGALRGLPLDPAVNGAEQLVFQAGKEIEHLATQDDTLEPLARSVTDCGYVLQDAGSQIQDYLRDLDADPQALQEALNRRAKWHDLSQTIGLEPETLVAYQQELAQKLATEVDDETQSEILYRQLSDSWQSLQKSAQELHRRRAASAKSLSKLVNAELDGLGMGTARVSIEVSALANANDNPAESVGGPQGADEIGFYLRPHRHSELLPLANSASGGELSRIMLALEVSLASRQALETHTFVFDEIDAGIGGQAGVEVGRRLSALARHHQVIVVTHLAQVAAFASQHIQVKKNADGTQTTFQTLNAQHRRAELARMLSGQVHSETALSHADELIALASMGQCQEDKNAK